MAPTAKTDPRWEQVYRNDAQRRRLGRQAVVGARFGTCEVLESASGHQGRTVLKCDCGTVFDVTTRQVWRGQVSRCMKCAASSSAKKVLKQKGIDLIADTKIRRLWLHRRTGMISRCFNPTHEAYACYGGRGITVYQPWIDSRTEFLKYVITLPDWDNPNTDADRENNDGNYEPGNIRVVPRTVNANNRRKTHFVDHDGRKYPYEVFRKKFTPLWAKGTLRYHLNNGRSPEQCLERYRYSKEGALYAV